MSYNHNLASSELARLQKLFAVQKDGRSPSTHPLNVDPSSRRTGRYASSKTPAREGSMRYGHGPTRSTATNGMQAGSYVDGNPGLSSVHFNNVGIDPYGHMTSQLGSAYGDPHESFVQQEENLQNLTSKLMLELDNAKSEVQLQHRKAFDYVQKLSEPLHFMATTNAQNNNNGTTAAPNYSLSTLISDSGLSISLKDFHSLTALRAPVLSAEPFGRFLQLLQSFPEHEAFSVHQIRNALAETDEQMRTLQRAIDDNDLRRDSSLNAEENVPAGEYYYQRVVQLLDDMLTLVRKRLNLVASDGQQAEAQQNFNQKLKEFYELVQKHETANNHLKEEIKKDLGRIHEHVRNVAQVHREQADEFERRKAMYLSEVENNQRQQFAAWARISQALEDIQQLNLSRNGLLTNLISDAETHQRRVQTERTLQELSETHCVNLEGILRELKQFDILFEQARSCGSDAHRRLVQRAKEVESLLKELRLDEHRNHLSVFRRYAMTVGDYVFRRDKRVGDILNFVKSLSMQRELARDVLDKHGEQYMEDIQQLEEEKNNIVNEITVLREQLDRAIQEFEPSEIALREANVPFIHPAQQLAEHLHMQEQHQLSIRKKYD